MHLYVNHRAYRIAATAVAALLAACSSADLSGTNTETVTLSFTSRASTGTAASVDGASTSANATATLSLDKVQFVVTKLELGRTDASGCVDDEDDDDVAASSTASGAECEHVSRDPLLIDMPVDGTLHTQLAVPLTAGTYRMLEAKLEPVNAKTTTGAAFLATNPELAGVSVKATGSFNGKAFVYKTGLRAGIHMAFNPPLVIDATTKNATVSVDVSKWFVNAKGETIDPSTATPGTENGRLVEKNIRASFHAFEDNGKKGEDTGEGHGKGEDKGKGKDEGSGHH